jgi:hypothetical protein
VSTGLRIVLVLIAMFGAYRELMVFWFYWQRLKSARRGPFRFRIRIVTETRSATVLPYSHRAEGIDAHHSL